MKKIIIPLLFLLVSLGLAPSARATLEARVDRQQLSLDETLNLTLTKDGGSAFSSADLAPLEQEFKILGRSQSSSTQFTNGSMSSTFSLKLTLSPKHTGILQIPPLKVGGDTSQPLTVKVVTMAQPKTRADNAPIFVETEVDPQTASVQEQVLLTLRIYWAVDARISEPEMPVVPQALVEKLNDATYSKSVNGRNYQVFERKYAIFPQQSGSLLIPPLTVRAAVAGQRRQNNPFDDFFSDFFANPGREIVLRSNPSEISVREKASSYPAGAVWLPTDKLTAVIDWSRKPDELKVGESTTVTITLAGQGLLASQLPPVNLPELPGLKLYQGKAEVQDLNNSDGVTGLRRESIALIPTRPGLVTWPELRIPWWNKARGRVEEVVLPARQLEIKGAPVSPTNVEAAAPQAEQVGTGPDFPAPSAAATNSKPSGPALPGDLRWWGAGLMILGLGWLFTFLLLLKTRRQLQGLSGELGQNETSEALGERQAFKTLARACRQNDPTQARQALLAWVKILRPGEKTGTGADLTRLFPDSGVAAQLAELDRILYSREKGALTWRGEGLLAAVEKIDKKSRGGSGKIGALPPLYK